MYNHDAVEHVLENKASTINRKNSNVVQEIIKRAEKRLVLKTDIYKDLIKELGGQKYKDEHYYEYSSEQFGKDLALYEILTEILNKRVGELTKRLEKYECVKTEIPELTGCAF